MKHKLAIYLVIISAASLCFSCSTFTPSRSSSSGVTTSDSSSSFSYEDTYDETQCVYTVGKGHTKGHYSLRMDALNENASYRKGIEGTTHLPDMEVLIDPEVSEVRVEELHASMFDTFYIGDHFTVISDEVNASMCYVNEIHIGSDTRYILGMPFVTMASRIYDDCYMEENEEILNIDFYFDGDFPEILNEMAFEVVGNVGTFACHYQEGAKGFDHEVLYGMKVLPNDKPQPTLPSLSVNEYARLTANKSNQMIREMFAKEESFNLHIPQCDLGFFELLKDFTLDLVAGQTSQTAKARAIYDWVSTNIEYDELAMYNRTEQAFVERKAVCAGFTVLMHDMLSAVGIDSVILSGYADYENYTLTELLIGDHPDGTYLETGHAWIALEADGEIFVADPTWGNGSDYYFDMSVDAIAATRVTTNVEIISVIVDEIDLSFYRALLLDTGEGIYALWYGRVDRRYDYISGFNDDVYKAKVVFRHPATAYEYLISSDASPLYAALTNSYAMNVGQIVNSVRSTSLGLAYSLFDYIIYASEEEGVSLDSFGFLDNYGIILQDRSFYRAIDGGALSLVRSFTKESICVLPSTVSNKPVKAIEDYAIQRNTSIVELVIPDSVNRIGALAFQNCINLEKVTIGSGVKSLSGVIFMGCVKLHQVILSEGLESIESYAFWDCPLDGLHLPASLKDLSGNPCMGIQEITIEPGNPFIKSVDGVIYSIDGKKLILYPSGRAGTSYAVPSGVKEIGEEAFDRCIYLEEITLPEGLETLGERAFQVCASLTSITIPSGVTVLPRDLFRLCQALETITLPSSITRIDSGVFYYCTGLQGIYFQGDETSWNNVKINPYDNDNLSKVAIHFVA